MIINLINEKYCFGRTMVNSSYYHSIFRFITNASTFKIRYETENILFKTQPHMGITIREGIALMYRRKTDVAWLPIDVFARTTSENISMTHLVKDEDYEVVIYGPGTAGLKSLEIEINDTDHLISVSREKPNILCVGGIHTVGAGCAAPQFSLPAIISRRFDAETDVQAFYMNNYVGHLPKSVNGSIDRYGNKHYDLVLFEGDYIRQDERVVEERFHDVIHALSLVTKHIIIWSSIPEIKKEKTEHLKELALLESSEKLTCEFIDCSAIYDEKHKEMCTFSQNFINEAGRILIYKELEKYIRAALPDASLLKERSEISRKVKRSDEDPMVSIILPVHNMGRYLRRNIESILSQSMKDFELICINNGSTDDSLDIVMEYAGFDERMVIISNDMTTFGAARNEGMELACGKYVLVLEPGDFYEPNMLEVLVERAEKDASDIVLFPFRQYYTNSGYYGLEEGLYADVTEETLSLTRENFPRMISGTASDGIWNKLFRRAYIEKTGLTFKNNPYVEDVFYTNMSLYLADNISWVADVLVNHRVGVADPRETEAIDRVLYAIKEEKEIFDKLHELNLFPDVEQSYVNHAVDHCSDLINLFKPGDAGLQLLKRELDSGFFPYTKVLEYNRDYYFHPENYSKLCML